MRTVSESDRLVKQYMQDVDDALEGVDSSTRRMIVGEVASHIEQRRRALDVDDPVALRQILEDVGDPAAIAEAAHGTSKLSGSRGSDAWVPWLLLLGAAAAGIGWFVGVGMLWTSKTWRLGDKLLGTLVFPGGIIGTFVLLGLPATPGTCTASGHPGSGPIVHCSSGAILPLAAGVALVAVGIAAPLFTAFHLERRRRQQDALGVTGGYR